MRLCLLAAPPPIMPYLKNIAATVQRKDVEFAYASDLKRPSDFRRWQDAEILLTHGLPCTDADFAAGARLRAVIVPSLGFEGVDVAAARLRGIEFAHGRVPENFETVAEAAILLMLMALYDVDRTRERLRKDVRREGTPAARMLRGRTIGLIGFGNIARALAERLQPWGVTIIAHSRSPISYAPPCLSQCDLDTLLSNSDIVLPLVPLTSETRHLLTREKLLQMKKGAILVNLSRGAVIDERALVDPEVIAHLGSIALDVYEKEPLPMDSPLRGLQGAILTGHELCSTQENLDALFRNCVANIEAALDGRPMPTAVR